MGRGPRRRGRTRTPLRRPETRTPEVQRYYDRYVTRLQALSDEELHAHVSAVLARVLAESALTPEGAQVLDGYLTRRLMSGPDD